MTCAVPAALRLERPLGHDEAVIRVDSLIKRYPGLRTVRAVDGITFDVRHGEVFGLLGPNGAGKTTTIGILTTRVRLTAGRAQIDGIDVARQPVEVKRRIAVVPQRNNLDRSLTARQNLLFHAAYFGIPRMEREDRADQLLDQFGLKDRANEVVDRYSGGMVQRLMIARALMHRPVVLFLDEPTTGLDPQSRLFVWDRVRELNAAGLSVVLTTHDMDEAESICHRVAIIDHGRLLALDRPEELKKTVPGGRALELRLVCPNGSDGAAQASLVEMVTAVPGVERTEISSAKGAMGSQATQPENAWPKAGSEKTPAEPGPPDGTILVRIYTQPEAHVIAQIVQAVTEAGADLRDLKNAEVSLEDVFIHFTGRGLR